VICLRLTRVTDCDLCLKFVENSELRLKPIITPKMIRAKN